MGVVYSKMQGPAQTQGGCALEGIQGNGTQEPAIRTSYSLCLPQARAYLLLLIACTSFLSLFISLSLCKTKLMGSTELGKWLPHISNYNPFTDLPFTDLEHSPTSP